MGRKHLLTGSAAVVVLVGAISILLVIQVRDRRRERELVHGWTISMRDWDRNQTEKVNEARRRAKLHELGEVAVRTLTLDLRARNALPDWHQRIPILGRYFPRGSIEDEAENVRTSAAYHLGEIGPAAKSSVKELTRVLEEDCERVRMAAAFSLGEIGDSSPRCSRR
jgi:hypothetical protein